MMSRSQLIFILLFAAYLLSPPAIGDNSFIVKSVICDQAVEKGDKKDDTKEVEEEPECD